MTDLEAKLKEISVAPRITEEDVNDFVASEVYFTAGKAAEALNLPLGKEAQCMTICVMTLKNGFVVTGESACASPENFNMGIGQQIARRNAISKAWGHLGFQLCSELRGVSLNKV